MLKPGILALLYRDAPTRAMLEQFAEDYYHSETRLMLAKQLGSLTGGLIPAILLAVISDGSSVVPEAADAASEVAEASQTAHELADTIQQLEETEELANVALDKTHQVIKRPAGLDEGAVHESELTERFPGYETENDLAHFAGMKYNLIADFAKNFSGEPIPKVLPKGTVIYRVIVNDRKKSPGLIGLMNYLKV